MTFNERSFMLRKILFAGAVMVCGVIALTGCSKDKAPTQPKPDRTVLFTEGFEGNLSQWEGSFLNGDWYFPMRITTDTAHNGTHSLTTDSNMTALYHIEADRVESGISGVEFYMMAHSLDSINFGVEIGQNPGSSGAVSPAFGIFFDPSDSIKCMVYNTWPDVNTQIMMEAIQADHWYKCKVEVNMTDSTVSFYLDDALKHTESIATIGLMGIDRLLVFRGLYGKDYSSSSEGTKPYYIDDITLYKK